MMLRAALVTPLSGPLASYGRGAATGLRLWAERAAQLPPPWHGVILEVEDSSTGAASAMRAAVRRRPHVVFGPYGSSQAVAALAATERVVWNHGGATSRLRKPQFGHAINVLSPASSYFQGALEAVRAADGEARTIALVHGNTGFGRDVAAGAAEAAHRLGFEVSPVAFDPSGAAQAADVDSAPEWAPWAGPLAVLGFGTVRRPRWAFVGGFATPSPRASTTVLRPC